MVKMPLKKAVIIATITVAAMLALTSLAHAAPEERGGDADQGVDPRDERPGDLVDLGDLDLLNDLSICPDITLAVDLDDVLGILGSGSDEPVARDAPDTCANVVVVDEP